LPKNDAKLIVPAKITCILRDVSTIQGINESASMHVRR